jgi:Effector-associated domain 11
MTNSLDNPSEKIRNLLSEGETKQALDLLALHCNNIPTLDDNAVMLQSSLKNLEQDVANGIISRENEQIEERRIVLGAIRLANLLEHHKPEEQPTPIPRHTPNPPPNGVKLPTFAIPAILIGVAALVVFMLWGKGNGEPEGTADGFDLTIELKTPPNLNPGLKPKGMVSPVLGGDTLSAQPFDGPGSVVFRQLDNSLQNSGVQIVLTNLNIAYRAEPLNNSVVLAGKGHAAFSLIPEVVGYSGKVLNQHGAAVAGAELVFNDGMAKALSDATGHYSVELPKPNSNETKVKIKVNIGSRTLKEEMYLQSEKVLEELKVKL